MSRPARSRGLRGLADVGQLVERLVVRVGVAAVQPAHRQLRVLLGEPDHQVVDLRVGLRDDHQRAPGRGQFARGAHHERRLARAGRRVHDDAARACRAACRQDRVGGPARPRRPGSKTRPCVTARSSGGHGGVTGCSGHGSGSARRPAGRRGSTGCPPGPAASGRRAGRARTASSAIRSPFSGTEPGAGSLPRPIRSVSRSTSTPSGLGPAYRRTRPSAACRPASGTPSPARPDAGGRPCGP